MPRFKALIEYDGTAYCGFQRQPKAFPTIQGELERAIESVYHQPVPITGAGRTDTGVHALGQVISFELDWRHKPVALQRALNANLPEDIAVLQLDTVLSSFHPRYDAKRRAYKYFIYTGPVRRPLERRSSWYVSKKLDHERMQTAAQALIGIHDFATFGQPPQGISTVRELFVADWQQQGEHLVFFIEASAFLYRMVRSLVGSLKLVGDGTWSVDTFVDALRAKDRSRSGQVAPPQGLYLFSVTYD